MRRYLALLLLAACGGRDTTDADLIARRAALGLPTEPLAFADAMTRMQQKGYEGLLARAGSKRLKRDDVIDAALEIENLLARADPVTAETRPPDPPRFDSLLADARRKSTDLARAMLAGGDGVKEAGALVASCTECHLIFRKLR